MSLARRAWIEISYCFNCSISYLMSLARRAWIEISESLNSFMRCAMSLARRAWIEMGAVNALTVTIHGCRLRVERGLKSVWKDVLSLRRVRCRLRVERGLKLERRLAICLRIQMSLARRAWIEITKSSENINAKIDVACA